MKIIHYKDKTIEVDKVFYIDKNNGVEGNDGLSPQRALPNPKALMGKTLATETIAVFFCEGTHTFKVADLLPNGSLLSYSIPCKSLYGLSNPLKTKIIVDYADATARMFTLYFSGNTVQKEVNLICLDINVILHSNMPVKNSLVLYPAQWGYQGCELNMFNCKIESNSGINGPDENIIQVWNNTIQDNAGTVNINNCAFVATNNDNGLYYGSNTTNYPVTTVEDCVFHALRDQACYKGEYDQLLTSMSNRYMNIFHGIITTDTTFTGVNANGEVLISNIPRKDYLLSGKPIGLYAGEYSWYYEFIINNDGIIFKSSDKYYTTKDGVLAEIPAPTTEDEFADALVPFPVAHASLALAQDLPNLETLRRSPITQSKMARNSSSPLAILTYPLPRKWSKSLLMTLAM